MSLLALLIFSKTAIAMSIAAVLLFFTMAVSEACLALRLLINNARLLGGDQTPLLHFKLIKLLAFKAGIAPILV